MIWYILGVLTGAPIGMGILALLYNSNEGHEDQVPSDRKELKA